MYQKKGEKPCRRRGSIDVVIIVVYNYPYPIKKPTLADGLCIRGNIVSRPEMAYLALLVPDAGQRLSYPAIPLALP